MVNSNSGEQKCSSSKPFVLVRIVIMSISFQTKMKRIFDSRYFEKKVPSKEKYSWENVRLRMEFVECINRKWFALQIKITEKLFFLTTPGTFTSWSWTRTLTKIGLGHKIQTGKYKHGVRERSQAEATSIYAHFWIIFSFVVDLEWSKTSELDPLIIWVQ